MSWYPIVYTVNLIKIRKGKGLVLYLRARCVYSTKHGIWYTLKCATTVPAGTNLSGYVNTKYTNILKFKVLSNTVFRQINLPGGETDTVALILSDFSGIYDMNA